MARQWTREELDGAHPLPDEDGAHWEWMQDGVGNDGVNLWSAVVLDHDYGEPEVVSIVCVGRDGGLLVAIGHGPDRPHADVCLAVILASKGLDSLGAMAAFDDMPEPKPRRPLDGYEEAAARAGHPHYQESDRDYLDNNNDLAVRLLDAYMLRRGTVAG